MIALSNDLPSVDGLRTPRLLNCIFSYERYGLLTNLIRSMDEFFPWGDTLVIDDRSTDERIVPHLEQRASINPKFTFRVAQEPTWSVREGGLYDNLDYARQYAIEHEYDLVFFIQDDVQFVWKDEQFLSNAWRILSTCGDASSLHSLFCKRIQYIGDFEYVRSSNAYRTRRGFVDISLMLVGLLRDHPNFFFADTERANSKYWLERGKRAYVVPEPIACFVPLTYSDDGTLRLAAADPVPGQYYVRPLDSVLVERLTTRDKLLLPFSEDYIEPVGRCRVPHWWNAKFERRYYALCGETFLKEVSRFSFPVKVAELKDWTDPSTISPHASHLNDDSQSAKSVSVVGRLAQSGLLQAIIGRALFFLFSLVIKRRTKRYMFSW